MIHRSIVSPRRQDPQDYRTGAEAGGDRRAKVRSPVPYRADKTWATALRLTGLYARTNTVVGTNSKRDRADAMIECADLYPGCEVRKESGK